MAKSDFARLKHMLEAANMCLDFLEKKTRTEFESNRMIIFATIRALEIFGEAAANISRPFQKRHPHIPWKSIIGMRNRLIHAYFDIDYDIVWQAVKVEIPKIIPEIEKLIFDLESESVS